MNNDIPDMPEGFEDKAFIPSQDIDVNRMMKLDYEIMRALYGSTIDKAATRVRETMKSYTDLEICTLLCKLVGATHYPQVMGHLLDSRLKFNLQVLRV